jgi:hypothetical protein
MFLRSSTKKVKHFLVAIFSGKSMFVGSKCHPGVWWAALRCLMGDESENIVEIWKIFQLYILKGKFWCI